MVGDVLWRKFTCWAIRHIWNAASIGTVSVPTVRARRTLIYARVRLYAALYRPQVWRTFQNLKLAFAKPLKIPNVWWCKERRKGAYGALSNRWDGDRKDKRKRVKCSSYLDLIQIVSNVKKSNGEKNRRRSENDVITFRNEKKKKKKRKNESAMRKVAYLYTFTIMVFSAMCGYFVGSNLGRARV